MSDTLHKNAIKRDAKEMLVSRIGGSNNDVHKEFITFVERVITALVKLNCTSNETKLTFINITFIFAE